MPESTSQNGASTKPTRKSKSTSKRSRSPTRVPEAVRPAEQVNRLHLSTIDRRAMVETAAYYRAERRRFASGHELEDWLSAEAEIEALLRSRPEGTGREAGSA